MCTCMCKLCSEMILKISAREVKLYTILNLSVLCVTEFDYSISQMFSYHYVYMFVQFYFIYRKFMLTYLL